MSERKTDYKVYFKFLTKEDYMGRSALRASSKLSYELPLQ